MKITHKDEFLNYTIPQILRWRANETPEAPALREKEFGVWNTYDWSHYYQRVRQAAMGLVELGLKKDDKLCLIGDNIPEMLIMEMATQSVGAVSLGIYQTSLPHEIQELLEFTDTCFVFCENQEQVDKLIDVREKLPAVKKIFFEDPRGMRTYRSDDWFMDIEDLYKMGAEIDQRDPTRFDKLVDAGEPDDVCHFCFTSGTTGRPKATMLTYRNFVNMGVRITDVDPLEITDEYVSFLPFAWIGEQMTCIGVGPVIGLCLNFPESVETSMECLHEIGPHVMFGAPRIWETIRSQIWVKIDESYALNKIAYNYFIKVGEEAAKYRMSGKEMPLGLKLKDIFGRWMIFRPLINQMGLLRLKRAYTGGAALGPELFTFYQALGVNLKQIYGQTEIIGIAYMHQDGDVRHDSVGKPLPGTECKISEEGEILSKSASVCKGYYKNQEATDELLEGGWLHSGDAGIIDSTGHLVVIDRLSDVMHNAQGEMFSPMFLENKLKFSPYIKEAVILGDKQDYVSALVNIDPVTVGKWAEDNGISFTTYMDLSQKSEVAALINGEVLKLNEAAEKDAFKIKRYSLLYKLLDSDDGELTKTGKIRRKFVNERYEQIIGALYEEGLKTKEVEATFQYQDGQTTTVKTTVEIYSM